MGLKVNGDKLLMVISEEIKSDQNGIESHILLLLYHSYHLQIKSDQNGIESTKLWCTTKVGKT